MSVLDQLRQSRALLLDVRRNLLAWAEEGCDGPYDDGTYCRDHHGLDESSEMCPPCRAELIASDIPAGWGEP